MAQFDAYRNPDRASARIAPYLLDIQTELLDHLATRVVVPLIRQDRMIPAKRLHPIFMIDDEQVVMATADLAAIRRSDLGDFVVSLDRYRSDIIAAVDFLITGI